MKIHLIGMGIPGSLLARHLFINRGLEFTWNDTDAPHTAWRASTGAIYPAGSEKFGPDKECWSVWQRWWRDQRLLDKGMLEASTYWFNHKRPPHEGRYPIDLDIGALRRGADLSYHLNGQMLVEVTQDMFQLQRLHHVPIDADIVITTHGFGERLHHVYWGWTRLVTLSFKDERLTQGGLRPCLYFREGRFVMAYAYPVPGTPYWYAGSSIIKQAPDRMRSLEMEKKYARWRANFERLSGGLVEVDEEGVFLEGWRPAAAPNDRDWVQIAEPLHGPAHIKLRPLWNSGIRHFPHQLRQVDALLDRLL